MGAGFEEESDGEGYVQDFELGRKSELYIYCRLCRRTYPVLFRPKSLEMKLRCLCGHQAMLKNLDVFRSQKAAEDHAQFYEKIYQAAKSALREAGLPIPPSGKFRLDRLADGTSAVSHSYDPEADESDIQSSYVEAEESDVEPEAIEARLEEYGRKVRRARDAGDVLAYHDILSELIEWSYCRRHKSQRAMDIFIRSCKEDIALGRALVDAAKIATRQGRKIKLSFSSFKHLVIHLEDERRWGEAAQVAEQAAALGLGGYGEKARELRSRRS